MSLFNHVIPFRYTSRKIVNCYYVKKCWRFAHNDIVTWNTWLSFCEQLIVRLMCAVRHATVNDCMCITYLLIRNGNTVNSKKNRITILIPRKFLSSKQQSFMILSNSKHHVCKQWPGSWHAHSLTKEIIRLT